MKKRYIITSAFATIALAIGSVFAIKSGVLLSKSRAISNPYQISFDSSKNKFFSGTGSASQSGDAIVKTDLGNDVGFSFDNLAGGSSSAWHLLKPDGYFFNTTPILGMSQLSIQFTSTEKEYKVYWSDDTTFTDDKSQVFESDTSINVFNFNSYYPKHFKFVNSSGSNLTITNMSIELVCQNVTPTLSLASENETMGSVYGGGTKHAGDNVTIIASPNPGYRFVGWYANNTLISTEASYSFIIGNQDLSYVARFTYESYNLVVQTESNDKGTVSNSSGSYNYLAKVTISAFAKPGYTFDAWYEGDVLVSYNNPYSFSMPYSDKTYIAKFTTNSYDVELTNDNPTLGGIFGEGTYLFGSNVTLFAVANTGVSFLGWYDGDDLVSTSNPYIFTMPHYNLSYVAKFNWTPYSIAITVNDSTMGSVSGAGSYTYGQEVVLTATPNEHHSFAGWFNEGVLVSSESLYVFNMPACSLNYEARFAKNYNLNVYSDDETMGIVSAPSEWGAGLEVTVVAYANDGYALDYWADENYDELDYNPCYSFEMPNHDVELIAVFDSGYLFTVTTSDSTKGTVAGGNRYKAGREVSAVMTYISGTFKGWYDANNNLVSKENPYVFLMPSDNYSLEAKFLTQEEEEFMRRFATVPIISEDGKTITYGLYPQKYVNDPDLISTLDSLTTPEANGWYFYNNNYYSKAIAKPFIPSTVTSSGIVYGDPDTVFDDGTLINRDTAYWFKCEPIEWKILSNEDGTYFVLSKIALDCHRFSDRTVPEGASYYPNNYKNSEIRAWLNDEFYNSAFSLGNEHVLTTIVNNSASTTYSNSNQYVCSNTQDKVFLLSYKDYLNKDYGFSTYTSNTAKRRCNTTDWAKAMGVRLYTSYDTCDYWTRSPDNLDSIDAECITYLGGFSSSYVVSAKAIGVRPAIKIKLSGL